MAVQWFLTKLNTTLPSDPATVLLGSHQNELETCPRKILHINAHSSLSHKEPKCPSERQTDQQPLNLCDGGWSAMEWNDLPSQKKWLWTHVGGTLKTYCWVEEGGCTFEKVSYYVIPNLWHSGKGKAIQTVKRSSVAKDLEGWICWVQGIFRTMKLFCMIL